MQFWISVLAILLCGCTSDDAVTYELDGVPVVVEGDGPEEDEMTLAVEFYRMNFTLKFGFDSAREGVVWRELREIRWPKGSAVRCDYNINTQKIKLLWPGCVAASELYSLLTEHYLYVTTGSTRHLDTHEWAERLADNAANILCN